MITLDGITFTPNERDTEVATCNGVVLGEVDYDDEKLHWRVRAVIGGEFDAWRPVRCAAEGRAFVVRMVRARAGVA